MWEDPIVAEVHRTREKLSTEYGFDVKMIFADIMKRQASLGTRLVRHGNQASKALQPTGVDAAAQSNGTAFPKSS